MKKAYNTVWREGLWRKVTESDGQEKEMDRTTNWLMILCVRGLGLMQINKLILQALDY